MCSRNFEEVILDEDWEMVEEEDEEDHDCEDISDFNNFLVTQIKKYPAILQKSQVPEVKIAKMKAAKDIIKSIQMNTAKMYTLKSLFKKVNNMKNQLKNKTDINRTGNKKIILKIWENEMAKLFQIERNPVFSKIPQGRASIICPSSTSSSSLLAGDLEVDIPIIISNIKKKMPCINTQLGSTTKQEPTNKQILNKYETSETRQLNKGRSIIYSILFIQTNFCCLIVFTLLYNFISDDLQRLVLLKQNMVLDRKLNKEN